MDTIAALCDPVIVMAEGRHLRQGIVRTIVGRRDPHGAGSVSWDGRRHDAVLTAGARTSSPGYGRDDEILKGAHLTVNDGEIVAIIGPNGAGKSTLLKTIAGLLHPSRGTHPRCATHRSMRCRRARSAAAASRSCRRSRTSSPRSRCARTWRWAATRSRRDAPAHRCRVRAASRCWPKGATARRARCRAGSARCWRWRWR